MATLLTIGESQAFPRKGVSWPALNRASQTPSMPSATAANPPLSVREKQVVALVVQGKQVKQIAFELHLAEGTIKFYTYRIFKKAGVTNRTELAVWAVVRMFNERDEPEKVAA